MKKLSQEYLMDTAFVLSIEREELLIKKYSRYMDQVSDKELKSMIREFKSTSKEHIKLIKDLMIKLNLQN